MADIFDQITAPALPVGAATAPVVDPLALFGGLPPGFVPAGDNASKTLVQKGPDVFDVLEASKGDTDLTKGDTKATAIGKLTAYGYKKDPHLDAFSAAGIGAFGKLKESSLAVSPDVEEQFRAAGIAPGQKVKLTLADGREIERTWDDRTATDEQAERKGLKPLRGRFDLYSPAGLPDDDGKGIVSFAASNEAAKSNIPSVAASKLHQNSAESGASTRDIFDEIGDQGGAPVSGISGVGDPGTDANYGTNTAAAPYMAAGRFFDAPPPLEQTPASYYLNDGGSYVETRRAEPVSAPAPATLEQGPIAPPTSNYFADTAARVPAAIAEQSLRTAAGAVRAPIAAMDLAAGWERNQPVPLGVDELDALSQRLRDELATLEHRRMVAHDPLLAQMRERFGGTQRTTWSAENEARQKQLFAALEEVQSRIDGFDPEQRPRDLGTEFLRDLPLPDSVRAKLSKATPAAPGLIGSAAEATREALAPTVSNLEFNAGAMKPAYGVDPARDDSTTAKVVDAFGSVVPAIASGQLGLRAAAAAGGLLAGESAAEEAERAGGSRDQVATTFATNAAVTGLSEKLLGIPTLLRAAKASQMPATTFRELAKSAAIGAAKQAPKEAAQESIEQIGQNIVASAIAGYDPERETFAGVPEAAFLGALVGGVTGGAFDAAGDFDAGREVRDAGRFVRENEQLEGGVRAAGPRERPKQVAEADPADADSDIEGAMAGMREQFQAEQALVDERDSFQAAEAKRQAAEASELPLPKGAVVRWTDRFGVEHVGVVKEETVWRDEDGDHRGFDLEDAAGYEYLRVDLNDVQPVSPREGIHKLEDYDDSPEADPELDSLMEKLHAENLQLLDEDSDWRKKGLEERRKAGWDDAWPFVPADLSNASFVDAIRNDPSISDEERARILSFAPIPITTAPSPKLAAESAPEETPVAMRGRRLSKAQQAGWFSAKLPKPLGEGEDLIDHLLTHVGQLKHPAAFRQAGREVGGEYDDMPEAKGIWRQVLFAPKNGGGGIDVDAAAETLYREGLLKDPSPTAFWEELRKAIDGRRRASAKAREAAPLRKQQERFERDVRAEPGEAPPKGKSAVVVDVLNVGDSVDFGPHKLKVIAISPEGEVTLEDGERYGVQQVEPGSVLFGKLKRTRQRKTSTPAEESVPFARRGRQQTDPDGTAAADWWQRAWRAIAPGAAKQLRLELKDPQALVDAGLVRPEQITGREQAAWVAKQRAVYIFDSAARAGEDSSVLNLVHEAGHAWWDTLPQNVRESLEKLWRAETENRRGPLFDEAGELKATTAEGVIDDVHEWFAERGAIANFEWANKRALAGTSDGSLIGNTMARMRTAWLRVREAMGASPDTLNGRLRRFLQRGAKAYAESDGVRFVYAGWNARGALDAERRGEFFPGAYDQRPRFEISDHDAKMLPMDSAPWEKFDSGSLAEGKLEQVLDHPKLFEAYPEIRSLEVMLGVAPNAGRGGSFVTSSHGSPYIRADGPDIKTVREILLHEIQHWIQRREDFAKGSSLDRETGEPDFLDAVQRAMGPEGNLPGDDFENARRMVAIDRYQRSAGEIEARDVAHRADLTEEQRKLIPPFSDEKKDAIVRFSRRPGSPRETAQEEWDRLRRERQAEKIDEPSIRSAYRELTKEAGFSHILISDLQKRSGVPLPELQDWLRQGSREGWALLARGDWSLSDADARAATIKIGGEDHLRVALKPRDGARFARRDQTETPEFQRWFGDSRVVDEKGLPLVTYHQTAKDREAAIYDEGFSTEHSKARARLGDEQVPNGIFFKPAPNDIGLGAAEKENTAQIPVYLSIQRPLIFHDREHMARSWAGRSAEYAQAIEERRAIDQHFTPLFDEEWKRPDRAQRRYEQRKYDEKDRNLDRILKEWDEATKAKASQMRALIDQILREDGYDGVIINNDVGSMGRKTKTFIALRSEQVKSAERNSGAFDPENPSILFARRSATPPTDAEIDAVLPNSPIVRPKLSRLYLGAADVLEKTPGLEFLGRAVRRHVDQARRLQGSLSAPFRAWEKRHGRRERKAALSEFESYQHARVSNGDIFADGIRRAMSPAGAELLELWNQTAKRIQERNVLRNVMVEEEGKWRPIRSIRNYFPRSLKPEVAERLRKLAEAGREKQRSEIQQMIADGLLKDVSEAADMLREAPIFSKNDYLGNIEAARRLPLPHKLYDYTFDSARRYMMAWAERMAQIEAFGQKTTAKSKDLFDVALERAGGSQNTATYIDAVRKRAYNQTPHDIVSRAARTLGVGVTGLQLGNPVTIAVNIVSGLAESTQTFGIGNSLKGAMEIRSLRKLGKAIDDAHEKGVLLDDLMSIMQDAEQSRSNSFERLVQKGSSALLKWSGYNASEVFVRAHNYATAKAFLRDALRAAGTAPDGRRARVYRAWFERNSLEFDKLIAEGGSGPATDRYLRRAVNTAQGGYRYDQVPIFMDTPVGRFLFKYQKWGSQATRNFMLNVVDPLLKPGAGPRQIAPALRYALVMLAAGAAAEELKERLFGTARSTASLHEIAKTLDADRRKGLALAFSRLLRTMIATGATGLLGNYAQGAIDVVERSRFKSPLNPPALAPAKATLEAGLRLKEQGKLTARDLDELARTMSSQYRTAAQLGARAATAAAGEDAPRWARAEISRADVRWAGNILRRYAKEAGVAASRTEIGRVGKTPDSATKTDLTEALLMGDVEGAQKALDEYMAKHESDGKKASRSIKATVTAKNPLRAGSAYGKEFRSDFLEWAEERLPADDVERLRTMAETYDRTAREIGLGSAATAKEKDPLEAAMRKIEKGPKVDADPLEAAMKRLQVR